MMSYLLDTHALVWWMTDDPKLTRRVQHIIAEKDNTILVSSATLWEIAIKERKGLLSGCKDYLNKYESWHDRWGFGTLDIKPTHAVMAGSIDWKHKDPFDRMLVSQSMQTSSTLITCDEIISRYHPNCLWD